MPTVSEVFAPSPNELPSELVGERSLLIRRLLELAKEAEHMWRVAQEGRHYAVANRSAGRAGAYFHAARILGWHVLGEGETEVDRLLERDRQGA